MENNNDFKCAGNEVNCNMCDERAFGRCPGFSIIMQRPITSNNNDAPREITTNTPKSRFYKPGSGYNPFNLISAIGH
ncbi:hypothetical protein FWC31_03165 [Candidatus Saccharibacteria bacterium]|nr:hypothetical protein [Candidatus Saccharibacteria bacterium]